MLHIKPLIIANRKSIAVINQFDMQFANFFTNNYVSVKNYEHSFKIKANENFRKLQFGFNFYLYRLLFIIGCNCRQTRIRQRKRGWKSFSMQHFSHPNNWICLCFKLAQKKCTENCTLLLSKLWFRTHYPAWVLPYMPEGRETEKVD